MGLTTPAADREENMSWIDLEKVKPNNREIVLIVCLNNYGKRYITLAEYVSYKSVLSSDYLSEDCENDGCEDYDEEKDCYWVKEGFFEYQYEADINYRVSNEVLFWMSKPSLPVEPTQ